MREIFLKIQVKFNDHYLNYQNLVAIKYKHKVPIKDDKKKTLTDKCSLRFPISYLYNLSIKCFQ